MSQKEHWLKVWGIAALKYRNLSFDEVVKEIKKFRRMKVDELKTFVQDDLVKMRGEG